jgi:hypothetical protein
LQGKIQKMLAVAEQMEVVRYEDYEDTMDSLGGDEVGEYCKGMYGRDYQRQNRYNDQSVQYSPSYSHLSRSKTEKNLSSFASPNNPISSHSSLLSSHCK